MPPFAIYCSVPTWSGTKTGMGGTMHYTATRQKNGSFNSDLILERLRVNRDILQKFQLSNLKDLSKPEFKGKISVQDLRAGAAVVTFGVIVSHKDFGPDFIRWLSNRKRRSSKIPDSRLNGWLGADIRSPSFQQRTCSFSFQQEGLGKNCLPLQEGILSYASGFGGLMAFADLPTRMPKSYMQTG